MAELQTNFCGGIIMKKFVMTILTVFIAFSVMIFPVYASTYDYIIDEASVFDDSNDMISMAKEIRNKLDFNIHIYSLNSMNDSSEIIDEYTQDSSVLLIFISKDGAMDWYSGSSVKHTIRDVDFEILFSSVSVSDNQYTVPINYILNQILEIYVYGNKTIDDLTSPIIEETSNVNPSSVEESQSTKEENWFAMNFNYFIQFIRNHPTRILIIIAVLLVALGYYEHKNRLQK